MDILNNIGLDGKDLRIIAALYWNLSAVVRVDKEKTEEIKIMHGVKSVSYTHLDVYKRQV